MTSEAWEIATPPDTLHLANGSTVPHKVGTVVFNHYDRKVGEIIRTATAPDMPTMPPHFKDGAAWLVTVQQEDGSVVLLDQTSMCTIEYAMSRGWLNKGSVNEPAQPPTPGQYEQQ